jgi:hypothetical protein
LGYLGGYPVLWTLRDQFDLIYGFALDPMHCLFLGIAKTMWTKYWNGEDTSPYYIGHNAARIDDVLEALPVFHDFGRQPRAISVHGSHWKGFFSSYATSSMLTDFLAEEWFHWIEFSLIALFGILAEPYYAHWRKFVRAVTTLLGPHSVAAFMQGTSFILLS